MFRSLLPASLILLVLAAPALDAQVPAGIEGVFRPHQEATEAISKLKSPYCPGFMLEVCTSAQAAALRDSIQTRALQGQTSDELVEWMLARYGQEYLAVPDRRGAGLWAWAGPPAAIALGLALVVIFLRRLVAPAPATPRPAVPGLSDEERRLLEVELHEIDRAEDPDL